MRSTIGSGGLALLLALAGVSAQEDPVLGNWRGTLRSSDGTESPIIISLVRRGDGYTGTTTGLRETSEVPLTSVAVEGSRVTIEAAAESRLGDLVLTIELTVEGGTAKGTGLLKVGPQRFPLTLQLQRRARSDVIQPQVEQRADYFVGRWKFSYVGGDYPPLSPGTRTGAASFARVGASNFVSGEVQSDVSGKAYKEVLSIGVDPASRTVVWRERRSDGSELLSLGNWQSPLAIAFQTAPVQAGGKSYRLRRVISVTSEATFAVLEEFSVDGGPFRRLGNGQFTRIE